MHVHTVPLENSLPSTSTDGVEASQKEAVGEAISTDLAPASAIAVLARAETPSDALDAALKPMAAGVSQGDDNGTVRVKLMFPDGSVLPVELGREAGLALSTGLNEVLSEQVAFADGNSDGATS